MLCHRMSTLSDASDSLVRDPSALVPSEAVPSEGSPSAGVSCSSSHALQHDAVLVKIDLLAFVLDITDHFFFIYLDADVS